MYRNVELFADSPYPSRSGSQIPAGFDIPLQTNNVEYGADYAAHQLNRSRNPLRRLVKGFYLRNLIKDVRGPTIDFGCGAGQLLSRLPPGSIGLDVNAALVAVLQSQGMNAALYDPDRDQLRFIDLAAGQYQTFVMSHVLEHFENAAHALRGIMRACNRLGVNRVIIVVPGKRGFNYDKTHRSFVNRDYLIRNQLMDCEGFGLTGLSYYPVNLELVGAFLTFHELKILYARR